MPHGLRNAEILTCLSGYVPRLAVSSVPPDAGRGAQERKFLVLLPPDCDQSRRTKNELAVLKRMGHRVDFYDGSSKAPDNPEAFDVIFVRLSRHLAAQLALGLAPDPVSQFIMSCLWKALPIYADFSDLEPLGSQTPAALSKVYAAHKAALLSYGMVDLTSRQVIPALLAAGSGVTALQSSSAVSFSRSVLTQNDLLRVSEGSTLCLSSDVIVTDLAKEAARTRHITLQTGGSSTDLKESF